MALTDENNLIESNDDIIDVNLEPVRLKKIRFDGDNTRIVYINLSDLGVSARLEEMLPRLNKSAAKACDKLSEVDGSDEGEAISKTNEVLKEIDAEMRELINYVFDCDIDKAVAPSGTMYDLFNGKFRFEHVIDIITKLYENNLNAEYKKLNARLNKHTGKYIKKK